MIDAKEIKSSFAKHVQMDPELLTDDMEFADLAVDSLLFIDAIVALQEEYKVNLSRETILEMKTVSELVDSIRQGRSE